MEPSSVARAGTTSTSSSPPANIHIGQQDWSADSLAPQLRGAGTNNSATVSEIGLSANPAAMKHGLRVEPPPSASTASASTTAAVAQPAPVRIVNMPPPAAQATTTTSSSSTPPTMLRQLPTTATRTTAPVALAPHTFTTVPVMRAPVTTTTAVPGNSKSSSSMERSVSTAIEQQRQRMAPVVRQKQIEEEQAAAATAQAPGGGDSNSSHSSSAAAGGSSGGGASKAGVTPGTPVVVAPSGTQEPWYGVALQHLKALVLGTPPDALSLGPPWAKWPDFSRTNNINALIIGLWPSVAAAVKQELVMQMAPQMMADAAKQYGAGVLTGLELLDFDLGEIPPRLDGIKVYDEAVGDEQVLLEVAVAWGSNIKVSVGATIELLGYRMRLPLTVQNLQVHTRARLTAQPLLDHMPYAGSVGVSLVEPPHIEFEVPFFGVDLLALPGVRGLFRLGLRLASRQLLVYPKGIAVPLVEGGAAAGGPEGMLEVRLVRIAGLRSEDLIGHSDPYVVLRLREGRVLRSRTINNNNNPEYDETFRMLVDDTNTQVLQLIVMDEDLIGGGKVMGVAQMPLKQSAAVCVPRTKVPLTLTLQKLMSPQRGLGGVLQLPVRVAGLPLNAAASGGRKVYQNLAGALGVGGGKGRTTGVTNLSRVLDETGWLGPSEEYLAEQGRTGYSSSSSSKAGASSNNPNAASSSSSGGSSGDAAANPAVLTTTTSTTTRVLAPVATTTTTDSSSSTSSKKDEWGGFSITSAAAPAGVTSDEDTTTAAAAAGGPPSPTGSASSFHTAFSNSSAGSSVSGRSSRSSSPLRTPAAAVADGVAAPTTTTTSSTTSSFTRGGVSVTPLSVGGGPNAAAAAAAVAASRAAVVAAKGTPGVTGSSSSSAATGGGGSGGLFSRERRTSDSELVGANRGAGFGVSGGSSSISGGGGNRDVYSIQPTAATGSSSAAVQAARAAAFRPNQAAASGTAGTAGATQPQHKSSLSRLDSQSAPLMHVYGSDTPASVSQAAAAAAGDDEGEEGSDAGSVGGSSSVSVSSSSASTKPKSKVVRIGRALGLTSLSKKSEMGLLSRKSEREVAGSNPAEGDAPPAEVLEHKRRAEQQEEELSHVKQMQADLTPGESGKGLTGDQLKQIYRGTVFLELTYTPFSKPPGVPTGAGASPASTSATISASSNAAIMPHDKGILAVTLVRARGLGGWQGEADPYCTLSLMDTAGAVTTGGAGGSAAGRREQTMRSTTIYNEDSPRWNESFDFLDIRADSILLATVWDQATIIDAAMSLKISRERFKDHVLGRVKVPIMDVANAGRIRKRWPLQGAMMGELEMILHWIPVDQLQR